MILSSSSYLKLKPTHHSCICLSICRKEGKIDEAKQFPLKGMT
jgi:hypothetical protein